MKKHILAAIYFICFIHLSYSQLESYDLLLKSHVDQEGKIDYEAIQKDRSRLNDFLSYLENTTPDETWSKNQLKAFWLNAYNAYTLKIIVDYYPVKKNSFTSDQTNGTDNSISFTITNTKNSSIMYIEENGKDAWNIKFAKVGNKVYTLNQIEHEIIRKDFNDGRIHAGLNAASLSGPKLVNYAYTEQNIEESLEILMTNFINDPSKNKISSTEVSISKVFEWYPNDFNKGNVISFINKYANTTINNDAKISYLFYDWTLNQKKDGTPLLAIKK
ncbi:DUF547 domain-containing protein [Tenacibaculum agarivorans]|uniref:DUF547 domain-containing protein n=1 Tax=Tenacibaculum agarivorans TaxID=1908389 RepID=UPI00094B817C|nr:DUF547 domain-containing protein [Tenacibaculum agarivorans]